MKAMSLAMVLLVAACASNSGVVPMGSDTYMVSRQAATGFSGSASLKAEALKEANDHCQSQRKEMLLVNAVEAQPPYVLGNYPKAEVQFKCVEAKK